MTLALGLLFLFYMVESLERERRRGPRRCSSRRPSDRRPSWPARCGERRGAGVALLGALVVALLMMAGQGRVALDIGPFLVVWGLLLTPTMIVWMTFIAACWRSPGAATPPTRWASGPRS